MSNAKEIEQFTVWQDREIRFDIPFDAIKLRRGELLLDSMNNVEDTKGNNGEAGALVITNLRMIWASHKRPKTNLSIGYNTIINITVKSANSRLRNGATEALYVLTKHKDTRFEFIFTNLVSNSPRLFTTVQTVHRSYETSKTYRDLKLRGAIIKEKQLILLGKEEISNKVQGVWNLSADQGNLGTFFVTNFRLVWYADLAENFNVSIPFMQMKSIKVRDSKFGPALVIETTQYSGSYVLGFRIDPESQLKIVADEIKTLFRMCVDTPYFGIDFTVEEKPLPLSMLIVAKTIDDDGETPVDTYETISSYYTDSKDRQPIYDSSIGLAIETPPTGMTLQQLWSIFPSPSIAAETQKSQ